MRHDSRLHSLCAINCPPLHLFARELLRPEQLRRSWYVLFFQLPRIPEWRMRGDEDLMTQVFMANAHNHAPFTRERLEPYLRQIRTRGVHGINYYRAAPLSLLRRPAPIFVPTRLIWGLKDPALGPWFAEPSLYEGWVERFDRVVIEDAGHFPGQEQPGQVNAALREHVERVTPTSAAKTEAAS